MIEPWKTARERVLASIPCQALLRPGHDLRSADPDEPLSVAVHRMWWGQVGALAVLREGEFVGSLGEQSLLRAVTSRLEGRDEDGALPVWDDLLRDVRVGEVMQERSALPVVDPGESLLAGLQICRERTGVPTRYLFVSDGAGPGLAGVLSLRDLARTFVEVYDGSFRSGSDAERSEAQAVLRAVLDVPVGEMRRAARLGHEPVVVSERASAATGIRAMAAGGRGYVVTTFPDGAPKGIFTRRDLVRVLARPHVDLRAMRLANCTSPSVKAVRELDTLCGLLKSMGMEGYRHMALVDEWDRLQSVISMWDAVWLLASAGAGD